MQAFFRNRSESTEKKGGGGAGDQKSVSLLSDDHYSQIRDGEPEPAVTVSRSNWALTEADHSRSSSRTGFRVARWLAGSPEKGEFQVSCYPGR
jgi:hypothetical protein